MTDFFAEKTQQVHPHSFTSFGIEVISRYGKASEIVEMIKFTEHLASQDVGHYVKQVDFDSKSTVCTVYISKDVQKNDLVDQRIRSAAAQHISGDEYGNCQFTYDNPS